MDLAMLIEAVVSWRIERVPHVCNTFVLFYSRDSKFVDIKKNAYGVFAAVFIRWMIFQSLKGMGKIIRCLK